jgi:hypothetical protein
MVQRLGVLLDLAQLDAVEVFALGLLHRARQSAATATVRPARLHWLVAHASIPFLIDRRPTSGFPQPHRPPLPPHRVLGDARAPAPSRQSDRPNSQAK